MPDEPIEEELEEAAEGDTWKPFFFQTIKVPTIHEVKFNPMEDNELLKAFKMPVLEYQTPPPGCDLPYKHVQAHGPCAPAGDKTEESQGDTMPKKKTKPIITSVYGKAGYADEPGWNKILLYGDGYGQNALKLSDAYYHDSENASFRTHFRQSIITSGWGKRTWMKLCFLDENAMNNDKPSGHVHISELDKADMFICCCSGYAFKKYLGFKVKNASGEDELAAVRYKGSFIPCQITGHLFHKNNLLRVKGHGEYEWISKFGFDQKEDELFRCESCDYIFPRELLVILDDEDGPDLCPHCAAKHKHKNIIRAYNDHHHPPPLYHPVIRRGFDGVKHDFQYEDKNAIRLFGVECEVEIQYKKAKAKKLTRFDLASQVIKHLGSDFAVVKEDGTLLLNGHYANSAKDPAKNKPQGPTHAGFEIASAPADLAYHAERWMRLNDMPDHDMLWAWDTGTCGMHVHVNRSSLYPTQIGRMLYFVNNPDNYRFIRKIAGRNSEKFCVYNQRSVLDAFYPERVISPSEPSEYDRSRRTALNVSNAATVEFRIFRGTINPRHIIRNVEFCDAVCEFCAPETRSLGSLANYEEFIHFVGANRRRWPHLSAWFIYQGALTAKKHKEGIDTSKFTIQPSMVVAEEAVHPSTEEDGATALWETKTTEPKVIVPIAKTKKPKKAAVLPSNGTAEF